MSSLPPYLVPTPEWSWRKAILAIGVVLLLFTEFGLRIVNVPSLQQRISPSQFEESRSPLVAHPYSAYTCKPGYRTGSDSRQQVSHNSLGWRGPETTWSKPEGLTRIVCVGGSSTYGEGVSSDENTWPAQLEQLLENGSPHSQFEVINLGVPGYTTFESLARFATVGVELKPDVVVIYHSLSDVRSALSEEPSPDNTHFRASWPTTHRSGLDKFFRMSRAYSLVSSLFEETQEGRPKGDAGLTFIGSEDDFERLLPEQGFDNFERNMRSLVALARSVGSEVVLVSQGVDRRDLVSHPGYERHLLALNRMTQFLPKLAAKKRIRFVDAATVLHEEAERQIEENGSENLFAWEDRLRDSGAHLLALTIADAVQRVQISR